MKDFLIYVPETGEFMWKWRYDVPKEWNTRWAGKKAGYKDNQKGYVHITINGKRYLSHVLAWYYMTEEWPLGQIDHINRIKNDNRWNNLRLATNSQNHINVLERKDNTSGHKGIHHRKSINKFETYINKDGKKYHLGLFTTLEDAIQIYNKKSLELFGEYAILQERS